MATTGSAGPGTARRDRARRGEVAAERAGGSALLFATVAAPEGGPAALLALDDTPLLARLIEQLASLGLRRAHVVTRPGFEADVRAATSGAPIDVEVVASPDVAGDLRATAAVAQTAAEPLTLAAGDTLAHREAIAGLLSDPRITTGVLVTTNWRRGGWAFRFRSARGRVVSASSPYHRVSSPSGYFLRVMKIDERDVAQLAQVAERLAQLLEDEVRRPLWEAELRRKLARWRRSRWLWQAEGSAGAEREPVPDPGAEMPEGPLDPESEAYVALRLEAARQDALSLLLVGLVRSDVHVGTAYLRTFYYARPLSAAALARSAAELSRRNEERTLLRTAVKADDGFFTTHFVSPYSRYLARFAARRGWTPNAITVASLVIGAAAAACFATGARAGLIAGAVLLQVAFTVDCVDGQLARYTRTFSKLGAWLDSVFDRTKEYLVYAGLAIGSVHGFSDDVWTLAACALALQTARHMTDFSYATKGQERIAAAPQVALEQPADVPGAGRDGRGARAPAAAPVASLRPALAGPASGPTSGPVVTRASASGDDEPARRPPSARGAVRGLARRGVGVLSALERVPATRWIKRVIPLPIGERFALISITAALWTPRVTFVALLTWGVVAAAYSVVGRVMRSVAS